jgi:hypothetical protein
VQSIVSVTQKQLQAFLLHVAVVRPVFIWGPPGIGKTALVAAFAADLNLPFVSLLGSQLAPEDLIGVPQIIEGYSRFCPPRMIALDEPYCLLLDELNAASHEVQKAFYSLIHEKRLGEYQLPPGTIVIGAGNRAQDTALVRPFPSALINRMVHVHLKVAPREWLEWAGGAGIHPLVLDYLALRADHLWREPPKTEEPFSTPRAWHMLSDALHQYGAAWDEEQLGVLAYGCLSPDHAGQFKAFVKQVRGKYHLAAILKGDIGWPREPENRDVLYFLAQSFRAQLIKELPPERDKANNAQRDLAFRSKALLNDLAGISLEIAQLIVAGAEQETRLPSWFMVEVVRDLPRLALAKK